jgi:hypothetical protein
VTEVDVRRAAADLLDPDVLEPGDVGARSWSETIICTPLKDALFGSKGISARWE